MHKIPPNTALTMSEHFDQSKSEQGLSPINIVKGAKSSPRLIGLASSWPGKKGEMIRRIDQKTADLVKGILYNEHKGDSPDSVTCVNTTQTGTAQNEGPYDSGSDDHPELMFTIDDVDF